MSVELRLGYALLSFAPDKSCQVSFRAWPLLSYAPDKLRSSPPQGARSYCFRRI